MSSNNEREREEREREERNNSKKFESDINSAFETLNIEPRESKNPYTRSFGPAGRFFRNVDEELEKMVLGSPEVPLLRQNTPELEGPHFDIDIGDFNPIRDGVTPEIERSLSEQKEQIKAIREKMFAKIKPRSESAPPSSKTGGTRKLRKRRKRRKTKRRKSKKGGGFFSKRKSPEQKKEQKKRKILMRLLNDKFKVEQCLQLNNTGKACQLDQQNTPGVITSSCASYNGMVRGPAGRMCGPVLKEATRIFQQGSAKKRRTKRRKRKRRNSTRRKKRS